MDYIFIYYLIDVYEISSININKLTLFQLICTYEYNM